MAVHSTLKFIEVLGFNATAKQSLAQGAELLMNPQDFDLVLFKMDPRQQKFKLSHQIVAEELIAHKFQQD